FVLVHGHAVAVGEEARLAGSRTERFEQHQLEIATVDRELRMIVACRAAERLLIDQLSEAVEKGRITGLDCHTRQRRLKTERGKLFGCMRKQVDTDANCLQLGSGLVDAAGYSGLMERECERQAADAGTDDDDLVHVSTPLASSFRVMKQYRRPQSQIASAVSGPSRSTCPSVSRRP